jgi:hypothetical protein
MGLVRIEIVDPIKQVQNTLADVQVGAETTFGNVTMFPLFGGNKGSPDYLTLDEALAQGGVRITEVSPEGRVPNLKFDNESDHLVLLLDGEELVGAKQNRVLNLTILAPAHHAFTIPVSCVEAGRWARTSVRFTASPHAYFAGGRAKKMTQVSESLARTSKRRSDQDQVWADIDAKAEDLKVASATDAMYDIYDRYAKHIDDYVRAFPPIDGQVGAAFAINGTIIGFDLFDYAQTLRELLPKLVRSYALDAIGATQEKPVPVQSTAVKDLLLAVNSAEGKSFPAIGEGVDVRFTAPNFTGAALVAKARVVHLNVFRKKPSAKDSNDAKHRWSRQTRL